jgi:hypothetical protein
MTHPRPLTPSRFRAARRGCGLALGVAALAATAFAAPPGAPGPTRPAALAGLPFYFEASRNPAGDIESFVARGRGCNFFVAPTEAVLMLAKYDSPPAVSRADRGAAGRGNAARTRALRFEFLGTAARAVLRGQGELPGRVNYLLGNDPAQWRTGLSLFTQARVEQLYPGVDLVYYGNTRRLEYDFIVAPGADPRAIAIRFTGADQIRLDAQGDLVFTLGREEIRQPKPRLYQTVAGARKEIAGGYQLTGGDTVAFGVGEYNRGRPLVIDPVLSYATFFGGTGSDIGWDLALDTNGFIYVAGETMSAGLATPGAFQTTNRLGTQFGGDAFVARFDNLATNLSYLTYLGGNGDDAALALTVDGAGNAFLTGFTSSTNFPLASALRATLGGTNDPTFGVYPLDAFVTELNSNGSALVFSTYLGGSADDEGIGIALDPAGDIYVTGFTDSTNFPTAGGARTNYVGGRDAFVTKLAPGGSAFVYSFYLGGTNVDNGEGIAADAAGNAYVTGFTSSTNFPITNAVQPFLNHPAAGASNHLAGASDAFLTKISPDGGALVYSTFLGGARDDIGFRLTLDAATNVIVAGSALSSDFPTVPASNTNLLKSVTNANLLPDVFVAKLAAAGTNWIYAVVFGGANRDEAWDVAVDPAGNAHLAGVTYSTNFPTAGAAGFLRATNAGGADAFVAVLNHSGTALLRSAYLGGSSNDFAYGIEVDAAGNDYLVGRTASTNFPTVAAGQTVFGGTNDAFLAKIVVEPTLTATAAGDNVVLAWPAFAPEFVLQAKPDLAVSHGWSNVAVAPVLDAGRHTVTLGATNDALFFRLRKP